MEENKNIEQEELVQEGCECGKNCTCGEDSMDDRVIELEIAKEELRIEKEVWFDEEHKIELIESDPFQKGLSEGAFYGGFITALINSGVATPDAFAMAYNLQTLKYNEIMGKLDVEKAKHVGVQIQQNTL